MKKRTGGTWGVKQIATGIVAIQYVTRQQAERYERAMIGCRAFNMELSTRKPQLGAVALEAVS